MKAYVRTDNLQKIECDGCGAFLCMAHEFDLNESYFFCEDCTKSINEQQNAKSVEELKQTT